jgi:hypothetical protein
MKNTLQRTLVGVFSLLILTACTTSGQPVVPTVNNSTSAPSATQVRSTPTAIPTGQAILYKNLKVTLLQSEITSGYMTEFGSKREPSNGGKFVWVEIAIENMGNTEGSLPTPEHFSLVLGRTEFKPGYGHYLDHIDYSVLKPKLFQAQKVQAWLRFEIPANAELQTLQFAYLPESLEISYSFPTSGYDWASHPIFLWQIP